MDNEKKNNVDSEKEETRFNAGGNDSDYDGGHPGDASTQSEGRIRSEEEQARDKKDQEKNKQSNSFNSGGNDSDYDGGHPKDAGSDSEGRIDSN